ncbi:MAG: GntR family transcriptional regulator [Phycisphaerae bacterium]|nr:GntR family transcriptional regulator [Phycisphaerae bacterium]
MSSPNGSGSGSAPSQRLSYKFQRLREQLRHAIISGELHGRLPGERQLGRRFAANAKTINKALSDLALEGLVSREIGRGTFVTHGRNGNGNGQRAGRSYVFCRRSGETDGDGALGRALAAALEAAGHRIVPTELATDAQGRWALSNALFRARADADAWVFACPSPLDDPDAGQPGEDLLYALIRRQVNLLYIGSASRHTKRNAIVPDYSDAAFQAADHLFKLGCERVIAVSRDVPSDELHAARAGCLAAGLRRKAPVAHCAFDPVRGGVAAEIAASRRGASIGILCLGGAAVDHVLDVMRSSTAPVAVAAVLSPGDERAARTSITAVEFDLRRIVASAVRVLIEWRSSDVPAHCIIPGALQVRGEPLRAAVRPAAPLEVEAVV